MSSLCLLTRDNFLLYVSCAQVCLRHCTPLAVQRLLHTVARGASAVARVRQVASQVRIPVRYPNLYVWISCCCSFAGVSPNKYSLQSLECDGGCVVEAFGNALFAVCIYHRRHYHEYQQLGFWVTAF